MARLWSCGFELGSLANNVEVGIVSTPLIESTTVRTGTYSVKIASLSSGARMVAAHDWAAAASNGPFYFRAYVRFATLPTAENAVIGLLNAATMVAYITVDSGGLLRLYDEDGAIGSASSALSTGTWYRVEMALDASGAGANDTVRGYLDGVEFAGSATRNLSTGITGMRIGGNLNAEAQTQGEWYFDDLAVNDSTGTAQTGLPGAGGIRHMHPTGAGDSAATSGTFADIDEVTPNDATDFIALDDLDVIADYNFDSWANSGGAADDTITLAQVGTRQSCETAAIALWKVHIKSQAAGTITQGAEMTQNDTTWRTNGDSPPRNYPCTAYVDPQAGGPWTPTLLDSAIAGVKYTDTDSTPDLLVSTLWLLVEFTPAASSDVLIQGDQNLEQQFGPQTAVRLGGLLQE